ncbi:Uncharacterized protein DAT39_018199, partial [Clarias magur]
MCGRFNLTPLVHKVLYQVVQVQTGVSRKPQGQAAVKTTTVKGTGSTLDPPVRKKKERKKYAR